jgi:hypothetical protein
MDFLTIEMTKGHHEHKSHGHTIKAYSVAERKHIEFTPTSVETVKGRHLAKGTHNGHKVARFVSAADAARLKK